MFLCLNIIITSIFYVKYVHILFSLKNIKILGPILALRLHPHSIYITGQTLNE